MAKHMAKHMGISDEEEEKENAKPGNGKSYPCDFLGCSKVYTRSRYP